jgi:hypothetical protein
VDQQFVLQVFFSEFLSIKASFIDSDIAETIEIYCLSAKSSGV